MSSQFYPGESLPYLDPSDSCDVEISRRVQCLQDGASEAQCTRNVCCWQTSDPGPACYYSYKEGNKIHVVVAILTRCRDELTRC